MAEEGGVKLERIPKLGSLTKDDIGKHVKLHGWVYSVRTQGAGTLCFVDLKASLTPLARGLRFQKEGLGS